MKIKYFSDTDTGLLQFSSHGVAETKEINENIYLDLDGSGNLVAMTIEHAHEQARLPDLSFAQIQKKGRGKVQLRPAKAQHRTTIGMKTP